jgi:enamine deaminase RidA (YjgF/YER057c/UK114 family)
MSNEIVRIDTKDTYSEIVIHNNTIYLSGQVPWKFEDYDIVTQCDEVFKSIDTQLERVKSDKTKIVSLRIYMRKPEDYESMNLSFKKWMPIGYAPSRATICDVKFPNPKWQIEVVVVAAQ